MPKTTGSEPIGSIGSIREFVTLYTKVFRYSTSESEMRSILSMIGPPSFTSVNSRISGRDYDDMNVTFWRNAVKFVFFININLSKDRDNAISISPFQVGAFNQTQQANLLSPLR
ncbi:unnamed protein product [Rhizophagus irregularis]|nr:unnamed protein product [Rhizophagus irregularis]